MVNSFDLLTSRVILGGHSLNFLRRSYIPKDTYKVFPFPKLAETIQIQKIVM